MVRRRAEVAAAARKGVRSPDQLAEQAALHPEATRRLVEAAAGFPVRKPATAPSTAPTTRPAKRKVQL